MSHSADQETEINSIHFPMLKVIVTKTTQCHKELTDSTHSTKGKNWDDKPNGWYFSTSI